MARYVYEVNGPLNESVLCPFAGPKLRGRWEAARVAMFDKSEAMKALSAVAVIPGYHIAIDDESFKVVLSDPLKDTDEGRAIFARVRDIYRRYESELGSDTELQSKQVFDVDADRLKDWMHWLAQRVADGTVTPVAGGSALPSIAEIKALPGRRTSDPWNTGPQTSKNEDDGRLAKYTDAVKIPGNYGPKQPAMAGAK